MIGMTDWGWPAERDYLEARPRAVPDILLGSGPGMGINGRIEADGKCLWARPYDKGRTINRIRVMAWPERTKDFTWQEPESVRCFSVGLGDMYEENPDVSAILQ